MAVDPLSTATRGAKRNLLIAAMLAITVKAFNISIDKIPVGPFSISYDPRVFSFLLLCVLMYFLCIFALYYFIDIRNVDKTEHQNASDKLFEDRFAEFPVIFQNRTRDRLNRGMSEFYVQLMSDFQQRIKDRKLRYDVRALYSLGRGPHNSQSTLREHAPEQYLLMDRKLRRILRTYSVRQFVYHSRHVLRWSAVRAAYFVRNYGTDGILPLSLGLFALGAVTNLYSVAWLQKVAPNF